MKKLSTLRLKEKGWSEHDIKRAERSLSHQTEQDIHFSKIVFWCALLVTIVGNIILSLILIPFLLVLNSWVLYFIVVILALMIGFIYNFLITDLGHLELKHHLAASIIIPCIALANVLIMVFAANHLIEQSALQSSAHSPGVISLIFAVAFILPYVVQRFLR